MTINTHFRTPGVYNAYAQDLPIWRLVRMSLLTEIGQSVALVTSSGALLLAAFQYRVKVGEEKRLLESSRAETDVRLLQLFSELMGKAHARGQSQLSETAVAKVLDKISIPQDASHVDTNLIQVLVGACVVTYPVGWAEQDAAIAALGVLGAKYPILREAAREGLQGIERMIKPNEARRALDMLPGRPIA